MKTSVEIRDIMNQRIKYLRRRDHYSQRDMANLLCINRRTYSNYERGLHAMPVEVLVAMADIFGTSLDFLTGRSDREDM